MTTFEALRALLVPYADRFTVGADTDTEYSLQEERPHHRTQFGVVVAGRRGVKLHFWPLHVFPELVELLPESLAEKRLTSARHVLKLDAVSADELAALERLVAAAWARIAARRERNPTRPYHARS